MTGVRISWVVAFMCFAATSLGAQVPADLQKTMQERDQAVAKVDVATWDRLTAADFTLVDETGTFMTKTQRLAQFKTQKPSPSTPFQRVHVTRHGDAYVRRFLSENLWVLDIWVRQPAGWRVAAVQITAAKK